MRGPAGAVNKLANAIGVQMPPRPLHHVLEEIIIQERWNEPAETPAELAEKWLVRFKVSIRDEIQKLRYNHHFCHYELNSANDDYIQGACFVEPTDKDDVACGKNKRANMCRFEEAFKAITPKDFEFLCGRVLGLLKVEEGFVSRTTADQGIDFFGRVPFGEILKPSAIPHGAERLLKIWLVGQAKHYHATQVSTKDIRELVGSVSLAKSKVYAGAKDPLSDLQMRTCDPVFFLFFTTGTISRDAWDLLNKSGVVAMDGTQLAVFLADHGVAIKNDKFDPGTFIDWMHS